MIKELLIHNGRVEEKASLSLTLFDRGVYYGDGCFETFKSYGGKFLQLEKHIDRLNRAIDYLGIQVDIPNVLVLKKQISNLLLAKELAGEDATIRIQVYRDGGRGFAPKESSGGYIIEVQKLIENHRAYSLITSSVRSIPESALSREFKLSNSLNYIMASKDAVAKGCDAALMLTVNGDVSETELANIFWYIDGVIYTPSEQCDILPGITRNMVIDIIMNKQEIKIGKFSPDDLMNAEAVWLTNSLREIIPVNSIDDCEFDPEHAIILTIRDEFKAFRKLNLA